MGVVVSVVKMIGGIVAGEGWVMLRILLQGDAIVYWCVLVWGSCGGGLSPCVVNRFLVGLKQRLDVLLDILFPSRNMSIALSSGLCLVHINGSIASLDLLGWVCFGYCLCCHSCCWRGSIEMLDLVAVFGVAEVWSLWCSR